MSDDSNIDEGSEQQNEEGIVEEQNGNEKSSLLGQKNDDGNLSDEKAQEPQGAPEKYEPFAFADGFQADDEFRTAFEEAAREANMPQDAAGKVAQKLSGAMSGLAARQARSLGSKWSEEFKADKEFGGDNLNESLSLAKKAISAYADEAFVKEIGGSVFGNHPGFIKFLAKVGKGISEDKFVGGSPSKEKKSFAQQIYGDGG